MQGKVKGKRSHSKGDEFNYKGKGATDGRSGWAHIVMEKIYLCGC